MRIRPPQIHSLLHSTVTIRRWKNWKTSVSCTCKTLGHPERLATLAWKPPPVRQVRYCQRPVWDCRKMLAAQFASATTLSTTTTRLQGDGCDGRYPPSRSLLRRVRQLKLDDCFTMITVSTVTLKRWFTDDTAMRFEAYGWHVIRDIDGHDAASIKRAVEEARAVTDKPSCLLYRKPSSVSVPEQSRYPRLPRCAAGRR